MAILKHRCANCGNDSYQELNGRHICANCSFPYRKVRETEFTKKVRRQMNSGELMNEVYKFLETGKL